MVLLWVVRQAAKAELSGLGVLWEGSQDSSLCLRGVVWHAYLMSGVYCLNVAMPRRQFKVRGTFAAFEISLQGWRLLAATVEFAWPLLCAVRNLFEAEMVAKQDLVCINEQL